MKNVKLNEEVDIQFDKDGAWLITPKGDYRLNLYSVLDLSTEIHSYYFDEEHLLDLIATQSISTKGKILKAVSNE